MTTRSISPALTPLLFTAAGITACGDALVTAEDRGDIVFGIHGQAVSHTSSSADDYVVGVLFVRVILPSLPSPDGKDQLETEVVRGKIAGQFPAQFHVELVETPRVYPYDVNIRYLNLDGTSSDGVFYSGNAPDGVRIGQLAIGPAEQLAALPATIEFSLSEHRTIGAALAPYLPTTTITSYQVIYAEGTHAGDVIYPAYTTTGITGGTPISDGFTLVDARTYFTSIVWQECGNGVLRDTYTDPDYLACLSANHELIACDDDCLLHSPTPEALKACEDNCKARFPGQLDRSGCLYLIAQPRIDATCGPERTPHPDQLHILNELEPLSVVLGDDDVKAGMWVLHATRQ